MPPLTPRAMRTIYSSALASGSVGAGRFGSHTSTKPAATSSCARTVAFRESEVQPHGGVAIGGLLTRGGDFYGPIVNLASRIGDIAVPNEILVTEEIVSGVATDSDITFEPAGRRQLKGFDEPIPLWSLS